MSLTLENLNSVNDILRQEEEYEAQRWIIGANELISMMGEDYQFSSIGKAKAFIKDSFYGLLDGDEYLSASALAFGFNYFDSRSQYCKDIFRVAQNHNKMCFCGSASSSKSFGFGIWLTLDYARDPYYTKVMVASTSGAHLKQNLFPGMINAVEASVIDLGFETSIAAMKIKRKGDTAESNIIKGMLFPQDNERSTGRFRGFKPDRRKEAHPRFGKLGRARIFLDEASSVSGGVFKDLGSPEASISGVDRVKIAIAFNPTDISHPTADPYSAPPSGIETLDPETDYEWTSKKGYYVLRLDGAKSENVVSGKDIIAGIQTREGFQGYQTAGENSADYWIYGRGFWPIKGATTTIIPSVFCTSNRGDYIFPEKEVAIGSADIAFTNDRFVMAVGKYGKAAAFQNKAGEKLYLKDRDGNTTERVALQLDALIEIPKTNDSVQMAEQIMQNCRLYGISPEWFVMDATSYGKGIYDILRNKFGDILGINWQEGATNYNILAEDEDPPEKVYANISTEMWYATRIWLEHGIIKFSHNLNTDELFPELTSRRFKVAGRKNRQAVESKPEYKKRTPGGKSCDFSDSFIQLQQLCRMRGDWLPSITGRDEDTGASLDENLILEDSVEEIDCLMMDQYENTEDTGVSWPRHGDIFQ